MTQDNPTLEQAIKSVIPLLLAAHKDKYPIHYGLHRLKEAGMLVTLANELSTLAIARTTLDYDSLYDLVSYPDENCATQQTKTCICGEYTKTYQAWIPNLTYHCFQCKGSHLYVAPRLDGSNKLDGYSTLTFSSVVELFLQYINYDLCKRYGSAVPPTVHIAQLERLFAECIAASSSTGEN